MMNALHTQCPPNATLRAFAAGQLAEKDSDAIFEHLRDCDACASELETVDDNEDSFIADLRRPDPLAQFGDEPGCQIAVARTLGMLANQPELPQRIGEYEVVRPLGRGGMGRVYLARHTKLGREVALKVLATHRLADPQMCRRFEAEMRAVGQLSHPNIVTAHDAREIDGTAVLVTEYIVMGTIITIEFPDGTATQIDVPPGSRVTVDASSRQGLAVSENMAESELLPVTEIGEGVISAEDPLVFVVLLNGGEVSDGELLEAERLLQTQLGSNLGDDRIVVTDAGIWIHLAAGVAAPIVREFNGKRYALASGSPEGRVVWDDLDGHITAAQASYDPQRNRVVELRFDDPLSEQLWELTSNHLHHPLAVVADGTIRTAPVIFAAIRNGANITAGFSEAEIRFLMQRIQGGLVDQNRALNSPDAGNRFQGLPIGRTQSVADAQDYPRPVFLPKRESDRRFSRFRG